jgi:ABC-type bacteriocin/lantibiotic exporter with double-glycine peptidase domain
MAFQSFASIGTGIIIGLIYGWKLALFIVAFVPLFLIAGILSMKVIKGFSGKNNEALEHAGQVRCVFSLSIQYQYHNDGSKYPFTKDFELK